MLWLLLRSGTQLRRLIYPCQQTALANSVGFVGYLLSLLGVRHLYCRLKRGIRPARLMLFALALLFVFGLRGNHTALPTPVLASPSLPVWSSPTAVSDVFIVPDVPVPPCSLDGGTLPGTPPCNGAEFALHDDGVDALINLMESDGIYFYQTALHPDGILGADDIVVIKVNNQHGDRGSGDGTGRLATNTDVLKGLMWRILQHPNSFSGEIVVIDNTQDRSVSWDVSPANAQDPNQSFQDVVDAFQFLGYPVALYNWTSLNNDLISGGSINDSGYPVGEYINGNTNDAYILLEDPAGTGTAELSYPKFQTANGIYVSMRYGVWNGSSYEPDRLTFINLPVLKRHGMAGATIAWKNLIGFVTAANQGSRYGGWNEMHDFFWGYTSGINQHYGLLGREIALIRAPDLHLVDAIWVAYESNWQGDALRQDVLLASTDPFAVDWYASEYVLLPLTGSQGTSAARAGTFRNATRVNQNVAESLWSDGSYPYIDLLDTYDGNTPSDDEKEQMNIYATSPGAPSLTLTSPNGGELWQTGSQYQITWTSTGTTTHVNLSYSTDGFTTISHTIATSIPNTGVYTWTTPVTASTTARVRVADASDLAIFDDSDADFTIAGAIAASLTLVSPNGGEVWQTSSQYQIRWTWTGTITHVSLSYSTDGFTAISHTIVVSAPNTAILSTPNTGIYSWTTPVTPSTTARVRVADATNPVVYDGSDADFVLTDARYSIYLPLILRE